MFGAVLFYSPISNLTKVCMQMNAVKICIVRYIYMLSGAQAMVKPGYMCILNDMDSQYYFNLGTLGGLTVKRKYMKKT